MASQNFVTDCFYNLSTEERIDLFKRRQGLRLDHVYRTYMGWMSLPFCIFGLVVSVLFIITVYTAIKHRRVSRKCYILLLNRAIGDMFTCVSALVICFYVLYTVDINREIVTLMDTFFTGCFWSGMVSYVSLSLLKLLAVSRPFDYRKWVTMKRVIYLIIGSWVMFAMIAAYTLLLSAMVKVPILNKWSGCKMETCARFMYRSRNMLTVGVYFFTLVVFTVTVLLIKRAQSFVNSFKQGRSSTDSGGLKGSRFPLWKLALNVLTFAGLYLFYVIWCLGLLLNTNRCFFMQNYTEMMRILAFVRCSILLRVCIDPIISFVTDFQMRRSFLLLLGINRVMTFSSSRNIFRRSTQESTEKENSSIERSTTVKTVC